MFTKTAYVAIVFLICNFLAASPVYSERYQLIPDYSKVYSQRRDPFEDGRKALKLAKKTGRLVLIEVGGQWCNWCHLLDAFIRSNKEVYDALYNNYVVLKVNVNDENGNEEFLADLPKINGYPHVFITRNDGTVIHSSDLTSLVNDGKFVKKKVLEFLQYWPHKIKQQ